MSQPAWSLSFLEAALTSAGEIHDYSEVGGQTYLARPAPKKIRRHGMPWDAMGAGFMAGFW